MLTLGILLVVVTVVVAIGIAVKANQGVREFQEHRHESFIGAKKK